MQIGHCRRTLETSPFWPSLLLLQDPGPSRLLAHSAPNYSSGQKVWLLPSQDEIKETVLVLCRSFRNSVCCLFASVQKLRLSFQVPCPPLCLTSCLPRVVDGHPVHAVQRLLDVHIQGWGWQYLVDWMGDGQGAPLGTTSPDFWLPPLFGPSNCDTWLCLYCMFFQVDLFKIPNGKSLKQSATASLFKLGVCSIQI